MLKTANGGGGSPQWQAGTVTALGSGISLASGTLAATGATQQWTAGTVTAVGSNLTVTSGTISASGGSAFPLTAAGTVQSVGQMTVTGANAGMAVVPNGMGAFMLSIPDNGIGGGNARGDYAIDLQTLRNNANQVASGPGSVVIGEYNRATGPNSNAIGYSNLVTGQNASAVGSQNTLTGVNSFAAGYNNSASGANTVVLGQLHVSSGVSSVVLGSSGADRGTSSAMVFSSGTQRAQLETYIFQGYTSGASPIVLTTDGGGATTANVATLGANSAEVFYIELTVNDRGNGAAVYTMGPGLAWRGSGNMTMGTGNPVFVLGPSAGTTTACIMATVPTVTADTANQGYTITITPNPGNAALLVCTARLRAAWAF
jgi:hypothetical protein